MFEHDFTIAGKHATYTKFLVNDAKVFNRYIDVFINGAIFGFLYGRLSKKDNESTDRARIYADAFATERMKCDFIYRLIMLLDETTNSTIEGRIDRAFKDDAKTDSSENHISNMNLFNSYVLGGIEVLYEKFIEDSTTHEDYIHKIYEIVSEFNEEVIETPIDTKIKEVIEGYK